LNFGLNYSECFMKAPYVIHFARLYRFDGFELDASTRVLTRNNTPIPLTPKTVDVLEYLFSTPDGL